MPINSGRRCLNSRNIRQAKREKVGLLRNKISNYINLDPHHVHEPIAPKIKMWSPGSKPRPQSSRFLRGGGRGGERQAEGGGASLPSSACRGLEASPPPAAASTWLLPVFAKLPSPFPQGQSAGKQRRRRAKTTRQEGGLGWRARGEAKSEVGANVPGAGGGEDRKEQRARRDKASEIAGERGMGAGHW